MTSRRPPRLAVWLLDILGYTRQNAALAGDLLEEYSDGRSAAWYWRQALMVMASGVARNAHVYRRYYQAVLVGFAAQSAIAVVLWSLHAPGQLHGAWRFIACGMLVVSVSVAVSEVRERVTGKRYANLQLLCCTGEGGSPESKNIFSVVAAETFVTYLLSYCLLALFYPHPSGGDLLSAELLWLFLFALTPALVRVPIAREEPPAKEPAIPYRQRVNLYPSEEISLLLAGTDGAPILITPDNAVASILTAVDEDWAARFFQNGVSFEKLHRAIWLGSSRNHLAMLKDDLADPPVISPADFAALLDEITRPAAKPTLWQRIRRRFR